MARIGSKPFILRSGIAFVLLAALALSGGDAPAQSRRRGGGGGGLFGSGGLFGGGDGEERNREGGNRGGVSREALCTILRGGRCDIQISIGRGLFRTGLKPRFPANAECAPIDEGWAISYTQRRNKENYHGGIDMPMPEGTPIVAAANGTVVGKFPGTRSYRGIEITLRHSPEETGLPLWIYTQYTHFSEMPKQEVGQKVRRGEVLGPTGNTGIDRTGEQSTRRRPAIHFGVFYSESGKYKALRNAIIPEDPWWMDPLALYREKLPVDTASLKALPEAEKQVPIAVMFEDGSVQPPGARFIWPYACKRK